MCLIRAPVVILPMSHPVLASGVVPSHYFLRIVKYTRSYMTMGRCPVSTFYSPQVTSPSVCRHNLPETQPVRMLGMPVVKMLGTQVLRSHGTQVGRMLSVQVVRILGMQVVRIPGTLVVRMLGMQVVGLEGG